jgi:hypothetical protein
MEWYCNKPFFFSFPNIQIPCNSTRINSFSTAFTERIIVSFGEGYNFQEEPLNSNKPSLAKYKIDYYPGSSSNFDYLRHM